eukprot:6196570-Pleurochrysis_carterae.AAC.1
MRCTTFLWLTLELTLTTTRILRLRVLVEVGRWRLGLVQVERKEVDCAVVLRGVDECSIARGSAAVFLSQAHSLQAFTFRFGIACRRLTALSLRATGGAACDMAAAPSSWQARGRV